jgi:hypothetical protein
MLHVVLDVYPAIENREFETKVGSYASCFVFEPRSSPATGRRKAVAVLREEGWVVAQTDQWGWLDSEEDLSDSLLRSRYRQALGDGIAVQMFSRRRELIGRGVNLSVSAAYRAFVSSLRGKQVIGLYSAKARRWAMSTTPDGDDYMPVWHEPDEASAWSRKWPRNRSPWYMPRPLPISWYEQLCTDDAWLGLGLARGLLVTWHPLQLRNDLGPSAGDAGGEGLSPSRRRPGGARGGLRRGRIGRP